MKYFHGVSAALHKKSGQKLTHRSIRAFWSHSDSFLRPYRPILLVKTPSRDDFLCTAEYLRAIRMNPHYNHVSEKSESWIGFVVCGAQAIPAPQPVDEELEEPKENLCGRRTPCRFMQTPYS